MDEAIERALSVLIGLPLRCAYREFNMAMFGFGEMHPIPDRRKGGTRLVATFALHVQCPCRFVDARGIIVGSRDMYFSAGADPFLHEGKDDWAWHEQGANRYDERIDELIAAHATTPLVVEAIEADATGSFQLWFGDGVGFEAFIDDSLSEHWRLFRPGEAGAHFVVTATRISGEDV